MTVDGLNGILPAVKYRVPARHERTHGNRAVFVLPKQFAEYMRQAGITPSSSLLDARMKQIGTVTRLVVIQDVSTIYVQLTPGRRVPSGPLQASFKISRKPPRMPTTCSRASARKRDGSAQVRLSGLGSYRLSTHVWQLAA